MLQVIGAIAKEVELVECDVCVAGLHHVHRDCERKQEGKKDVLLLPDICICKECSYFFVYFIYYQYAPACIRGSNDNNYNIVYENTKTF